MKNSFRALPKKPLLAVLFFSLLLLTATALRLNFAPHYAHDYDQGIFLQWTHAITEHGIAAVYRTSATNYPPVTLALFGITGEVLSAAGSDLSTLNPTAHRAALKTFAVIFDLLTVGAVYVLVGRRCGWWWALIPAAALAFNPVAIINSSLWGQVDPVFAFWSVLAVGALAVDRPRTAWVWFALAILSKIQPLVTLPLLVGGTLTLHREPERSLLQTLLAWRSWRRLLSGVGICGAIFAAVYLPFYLNSGGIVFRGYLHAGNSFGGLSFNAYNLWYAATESAARVIPHSESLILPVLTAYQTGLILLGLVALVIGIIAVTDPRRNDWLLAGLLSFALFMLPTQMHERHLYAAVPLLAAGIVKPNASGKAQVDWLAGLLFVGVTLTGWYNLQYVLLGEGNPDYAFAPLDWLFPGGARQVAWANVVLFVVALVSIAVGRARRIGAEGLIFWRQDLIQQPGQRQPDNEPTNMRKKGDTTPNSLHAQRGKPVEQLNDEPEAKYDHRRQFD